MKKGDILTCNDGVTNVELVDFDSKTILVRYNNKLYERPKSDIGKKLHYEKHCWSCQAKVSSRFCTRCPYCGWFICSDCGSCRVGGCEYSSNGFNKNGIHRNGTRFSDEGYDCEGYDRNGYNRNGFDRNGFDKYGYDKSGYNRLGYDQDGFGRDGYNQEGYNRNGFDRIGYDKYGYDRSGYNRSGYDRDGYSRDGYNTNGINREGIDKYGLNEYWRKLNTNRIWYKMKDGSKKTAMIYKCYSCYIDIIFDNGEKFEKIDYLLCINKGIIGPIYKN